MRKISPRTGLLLKPKEGGKRAGFFPAGVLAKVFGKRFKDWKQTLMYKKAGNLSFLEVLITRLQKDGEFQSVLSRLRSL
jgi:hypothetical protein